MEDIANRNCTTTLRGIATLIIMIGHVGVSGFGCRLFNPFGGIGVAMFLFLSGYGLSESFKKNGLNHFWKKKVIRIVIPYIIWIPIYHLAIRFSPLGSVYHLEIIPRYWFIEYLIITYILFYFLFHYYAKQAIIVMGIMGIISVIVLSNLRAEQSFSFLAGIIFSHEKDYFRNSSKKHVFTLACIFFTIGISALLIKQLPQLRVYDLESLQFKVLNLFIKLPLGLSILFLTFALKPNGTKWLSAVGNIAYELYLTHVSFFMTIAGRSLYLIVFIIQTFILAYIIHYLNKYIPNKNLTNGYK